MADDSLLPAGFPRLDRLAIGPRLPDLVPMPPITTEAQRNYASEFHDRLMEWINNFDASLDEQYEVGVRLVNFGQSVTFHLDHIGYWNPSLITFSGTTEDGNPVELIQHVIQISVLLVKLPRKNPEEPKRPIGFSGNSEAASADDIDR